jgi:hypothetical protein
MFLSQVYYILEVLSFWGGQAAGYPQAQGSGLWESLV